MKEILLKLAQEFAVDIITMARVLKNKGKHDFADQIIIRQKQKSPM